MSRSDLCDYNDAYIVVTGNISVANADNDAYDRKFTFKNNVLFFYCISKINGTLIENAEDLDVVIYFITLKTIETQQNLYGIIIEKNQILDIIITTEIEYIIQSKIQNLLIIKQILQVN